MYHQQEMVVRNYLKTAGHLYNVKNNIAPRVESWATS